MAKRDRRAAYADLHALAQKHGYLTTDAILDCADKYALPIDDFDWLVGGILSWGIPIYSDAPPLPAPQNFAGVSERELYREAVRRCPSLAPFVREVQNIKKPRTADMSSSRLIEIYLPLALRIAMQRAATFDLDLSDAVGDACLGLLLAAQNHSVAKSPSFVSYASLWILQTITRRAVTRRPLVHCPAHLKEQYCAVYPLLKSQGCIDCEDLQTCEKARDMVRDTLLCSEKTAQVILAQMVPDLSLEDLLPHMDSGEVKTPAQLVISEEEFLEGIFDKMRADGVREVLHTLKPREADVIRLRYGLDGPEETLEQIGERFHLSRERIWQIERKAMRKLRSPSRSEKLKDYD